MVRTPSFNPTLVRLRHAWVDFLSKFGFRFNPTLVRLRPVPRVGDRFCAGVFQSHAGSIEAKKGKYWQWRKGQFQSHAGSIEAYEEAVAEVEATFGFNPTLVRLRHADVDSQASCDSCFNPTLVRLRHNYKKDAYS